MWTENHHKNEYITILNYEMNSAYRNTSYQSRNELLDLAIPFNVEQTSELHLKSSIHPRTQPRQKASHTKAQTHCCFNINLWLSRRVGAEYFTHLVSTGVQMGGKASLLLPGTLRGPAVLQQELSVNNVWGSHGCGRPVSRSQNGGSKHVRGVPGGIREVPVGGLERDREWPGSRTTQLWSSDFIFGKFIGPSSRGPCCSLYFANFDGYRFVVRAAAGPSLLIKMEETGRLKLTDFLCVRALRFFSAEISRYTEWRFFFNLHKRGFRLIKTSPSAGYGFDIIAWCLEKITFDSDDYNIC